MEGKLNFDAVPTEASADVMRSSGARDGPLQLEPRAGFIPPLTTGYRLLLGRCREALG